jgi:hypothetical protein
MHSLASHLHLTAVYRCQKGGIHLVYQNLNIGMTPVEFYRLNLCAQEARGKIERGEWISSCVLLSYKTTSLVLTAEDFVALARTMAQAGQTVEALIELESWEEVDATRDQEARCLAGLSVRVEPVTFPALPVSPN